MKTLSIILSNELYKAFERLTKEKLLKKKVSKKEVETFLEDFLEKEYSEVGF